MGNRGKMREGIETVPAVFQDAHACGDSECANVSARRERDFAVAVLLQSTNTQ
jgi:hypothetical protein